MKLTHRNYHATPLLFVALLFAIGAQAQVAAPVQSNLNGGIQIQLPSPGGTVLVTPDLLNKQSHLSWASILPGSNNISNLNWHETSFNLPDSSHPAIEGLANIPGESQFYVIYQDGTIMQSTASATGLTPPVFAGRDTNYAQFSYTKLMGKNTLYMLMTNGQIDISRDGGQSWQMDTGGAGTNSFVDLAVDTFRTAFAFYSPGGTVSLYKQNANSNVWGAVNFPGAQLPFSLFIDRRNRIYIGTYGNGVYCSKDTGNTWTRSLTTLNGARPDAFSGFSDDAYGNIYMIANGGAQLYRSTDSGANWTEIGAPIEQQEVDSNYIDVFNSISGDTVLTAFTIYGTFVSTDQGNTWAAANNGLHETQFNGFYKCSNGRLIENSNNGSFYEDLQSASFTQALPVNGYGYAGPILADTTGNIYTTTQNGYISSTTNFYLKSSNNGTSWQADTAGISVVRNPGCFGVDEYGNEHLSGRGNFDVGLLYKKTAGTNNYILDTAGLYGMTDPFYAINALVSDDNGKLFLGGGGDASLLTCWSRAITGSQWALDTAGLSGFSPITYFTRESNHNMIAMTGDALFYHESGVWHSISLPTLASGGYLAINAVATDNSGGIIASFTYSPPSFLYSYGYGIFCTHDHGSTWNEVGLTGEGVYALHNFGDTTYALSNIGIYALTCNGIAGNPLSVGEVENNAANVFNLYPNPSSGICHAAFTITSLKAKSELTILDISGRTIKNIIIEAGANETTFNTTDMNGGIYFCLLKTNEALMDVKKLVVAK